jgi:glycine/D-amino acid oxidase-like deaminating enzyme
VIGCSIAYHLGRRGITSAIVERESIATRASGKAWAVFTYAPAMLAWERMRALAPEPDERGPIDLAAAPSGEGVERWLHLHSASYDRMPELALELAERGGIDVEYCETPSTYLVTRSRLEEAGGPQELLRPYREAGCVETDWLDGDALRAEFPSLHPQYVGGISDPAGQVEPYKFTLGLAQAAKSLGAEVVSGELVGFETEGERITGVRLASGALLEADAVVLAMGPWTPPAAAKLGAEIDSRTFLIQCLRAEMPGGLPLHTLGAGDYWILPKKNGEVILAMYGPDFLERPDLDATLTEEVKLEILRGVVQVLPVLENAKILEHRGDLLSLAAAQPHHRPVLGRLPGWSNGYVASRFGAVGVCMSPAVGEILAELIDTGVAPLRARRLLEWVAP